MKEKFGNLEKNVILVQYKASLRGGLPAGKKKRIPTFRPGFKKQTKDIIQK